MTARHEVGVALYTGQGGDLRDAPALAAAAEEAGFDSFWVSEHHGIPDGYLPSPLVLLAALAGATSRIRLGTGLLIAPLHHPLRIAEDAAVVDRLSGGRLILGLGLGYAEHEYRAFGVDGAGRGDRLEALVPMLRRAWTGEPFSAPELGLHDVRVTPPPAGRIPVWLGGYAARAVARAGRVADGHLVGRGEPGVIDDASAHLGPVRDPAEPGFARAVIVTVALDAPGGGAESARTGFAAQQRMYESIQTGREVYAGLTGTGTGTGSTADGGLLQGSIDEYFQVSGSAEQVVRGIDAVFDRLSDWAEVHVVLRVLFPEPDPAVQLARIRTLGRGVLPRLAHRTAPLTPR
ncbi:LLM class flavin-dependent oxidoreductase [Pseudonocardia parietis]|uniref:Alkanesulfonate monooxygenase SsuD/methylene tetrahydromethanopterin reductase-like flavin-dependent oxidoreductase (Luciferase family) n=1 Tax=Pseudonocardia parietis TaxID=570936 RepID=A0ABS4VRL6_9PSEU|nr:LLM class flavin-dependent oxidoreductase [Pseudonocardia parietis]MBP2366562.1 alkanesulfonate monooxygenase SsuD/methylene tetrahydromethanopterin reductase-like flavin-dependent oxidoreductase (luciferase family) [Pseudonocardia parietis]